MTSMRRARLLQVLRVAVSDTMDLKPYRVPKDLPAIGMMYAEVGGVTDKPRPAELQADDIIQRMLRLFKEQVGLLP